MKNLRQMAFFKMIAEISFYSFTPLPDEKQYELVFTDAEFINFREVGSSKFVLYRLYGFFVELQYDVLQNHIMNKIVFQGQNKSVD